MCCDIYPELKDIVALQIVSKTVDSMVKNNVDDMQHRPDVDHKNAIEEDDLVWEEILVTCEDLYRKIIELVALYYCSEMLIEIETLYNQGLLDVSKICLKLIYLLSQYVPLILKNKHMSILQKIKKLSYVSAGLCVSIGWLKAFGDYINHKHYASVEEIET